MGGRRKKLAVFVVLEGILLVALVISEVRQIPDTVDDLLRYPPDKVASVYYSDRNEIGHNAKGDRTLGQQLLEVIRKGKLLHQLRGEFEYAALNGAFNIVYEDGQADGIVILERGPVLVRGYPVSVDREALRQVLGQLTPVRGEQRRRTLE